MFAPLEGTGEVEVPVPPATAFAFLADPHHAQAWFAGAGFAVPPEGPARLGLTWSFERTPGTRRVLPVAITVFEPPRRFRWQTQRGPHQDANSWEVRCNPIDAVPKRSGTRLRITIALAPGPLGWLSILLYRPLVRRALRERAQRAAERARDALVTQLGPPTNPPRRPDAGDNRPGRKRPRRR